MHPDELTEEEWRKDQARIRGEDYVHPDDHAPDDLRLSNARLAIFHELDPEVSEVWQKAGRSTQNEYAKLMVEGMPSVDAAKRFIVEHYA